MILDITIRDCENIKFHVVPTSPIIKRTRLSPLIADPSVLTPDSSPDGLWHLFAHSIWGIHHYSSIDGIHFLYENKVISQALRPYIYKEEDTYYLFFEKYNAWKIIHSILSPQKWQSSIAYIYSKDLIHWSSSSMLMSPIMPYHRDPLGDAIGNPCVLKDKGRYLFYYSSSLVHIADCGFNEPRYVSLAISDTLLGGYIHLPTPILSPLHDKQFCNLGAGSLKVIKVRDGFIGFQNCINEIAGKSGSSIWLLHSTDGIIWSYFQDSPILEPTHGWMGSHIYACSPHYYQGRWMLYFNARNHAHWSKGTEHIGLAIGQ